MNLSKFFGGFQKIESGNVFSNIRRIFVLYSSLSALMIALSGCAENNLPNSPIDDAALVWVALPGGKGNWMKHPGNSSVNITKVDDATGYFPPSHTMRVTVDANGPLYLSPGQHNLGLLCDILFVSQAYGASSGDTVEFGGRGQIEADFAAHHKYRFIAEFSLQNDQAGNFEVTLFDITAGDANTGIKVGSWSIVGGETLGPPHYVPPTSFPSDD